MPSRIAWLASRQDNEVDEGNQRAEKTCEECIQSQALRSLAALLRVECG